MHLVELRTELKGPLYQTKAILEASSSMKPEIQLSKINDELEKCLGYYEKGQSEFINKILIKG